MILEECFLGKAKEVDNLDFAIFAVQVTRLGMFFVTETPLRMGYQNAGVAFRLQVSERPSHFVSNLTHNFIYLGNLYHDWSLNLSLKTLLKADTSRNEFKAFVHHNIGYSDHVFKSKTMTKKCHPSSKHVFKLNTLETRFFVICSSFRVYP